MPAEFVNGLITAEMDGEISSFLLFIKQFFADVGDDIAKGIYINNTAS